MSGKISRFIVRLMTIAIGMLLICAPVWAESGEPAYPYHGVQFDRFVDQSFAYSGPGEPKRFYDWMDRAYRETRSRIPGNKSLLLGDFLASRRALLAATKDPAKKSAAEVEVSANVHKLVKAMIPRFSLDRGFEFRNVVKYGERQCFLQSVLIAGMLQRIGMNAGVAMVYRNITGQPTNNGHAITLLKLPNGKSIIVDASEPEPFARHQGLFVRTRGYQYVDPMYAKRSDMISFYRASGKIEKISTDRVHGLDLAFLDSQFWFYRGERAKGGLILLPRTKDGLEASAAALRTSVKLCPANPLSVYTLGRVYQAQGKSTDAAKMFTKAYALYARFGWIPDGAKECFASTQH